MKHPFFQVDAFSNTPLSGNYAGVMPLDTWLSDNLMQSIANENNVSETAFFVLQADGSYHIRWFSPVEEISFCGHATLASAFILFRQHPKLDCLVFYADAVGFLNITRHNDFIRMALPKRPLKVHRHAPQALLDALPAIPLQILQNQQAYVVVLENADAVRAIDPDLNLIKTLAPFDVCVTAVDNSGKYDFVSRYFWPANGGDEDPVTGSMHTGLAPFWAEKLNKTRLKAYQGGLRGGELICEVEEDNVIVLGQGALYLEGHIYLPD